MTSMKSWSPGSQFSFAFKTTLVIRVLNLHKSYPVHQEEIADGIATLVIVLFHTDAIAHFLARELFRLQFLVALM